MKDLPSKPAGGEPEPAVLEPAADEPNPRDAPGEELLFPGPPAEDRRAVVLLATRRLQVRALGTTVLEAAGFVVKAAASGPAVLDEIAISPPDLILTDLALGDMDAGVLCSRVRELSTGLTVPILVISDTLHSAAVRSLFSEALTDLVPSPVNWKALTQRVRHWIAMTRKLRALSHHESDLDEVRFSARQASTELLQARNYDAVTGLPNREMFVSMLGLVLSQGLRSGNYPAVLYLDIDDFKEVNDLIGRAMGDELLRLVAQRLRGCLRQSDVVSQAAGEIALTSFSRLTGDQFAILISGVVDKEGAAAVARRLLESISRPFRLEDRMFRLTARIGIADASELDGEGELGGSAEEILVQRAEVAVRYCKQRKGKPFAFFESFMDELMVKKHELKTELQQALDQEQLFLCYQLLVDAESLVPTGVEGLVRWQHPARGLVPPSEFLHVAEQSDLILDIDRWVLAQGCRQAKRWLDAGHPPVQMSLNVSIRFLEEEDFAEQVLAIIDETGLPPSSLQLELSERGALPNANEIVTHFETLSARGVHLALDDFGTGQTSLSYLRTLPVDCVKVDQSFVRRIPDDSASMAIVTAIAAMANHLELKAVAEGVETEEQRLFLCERGFDQLQGFLFARPEPSEAVTKTLRDLGNGSRPRSGARRPPETERTDSGKETGPSQRLAPRTLPGDRPEASSLEGREGRDGPDRWSGVASYLLELARMDFLTKLNNRFALEERLEHAVAHADRFEHKVALLLIDLDDFKYVNDTHGHAVGDGLLVAIANRLQDTVRRIDTLARVGGDEFAVIFSEFHDLKNVAELARRLLAELSQPVEVEGRELAVSGSLGISVYPAENAQAKDLLRQADLALYKAKDQGGNRVTFFAQEMEREVQRDLALARDLEGAVERGELFIEYQPQIALQSGSIVGAEALVRWNHPAEGRVEPRRFLPIAESTGEVLAIGRWVIRSACAEANRWRSHCGREVRVSVNLSPVQCRDDRFLDIILQALKDHEVAPELLDLEIDERFLKHLRKDQEASLRKLGEFGIGLTLDNFGSGSSALEHFQRFRFARLKIDRSLIQSLGRQPGSPSVAGGIVALARRMSVQIVAEGIEKPAELEALKAEGCEVGQGFLFSKPLSADALAELMSGSATLPKPRAKPRRRRFTAAYKLRILARADRCTKRGAIRALLEREGLYSSYLSRWRRQREAGTLKAPKKREPKISAAGSRSSARG